MGQVTSLYVHIPFCKKKCGYCDFLSFSGREKDRSLYIDALIKEIEMVTKDKVLSTIFIGGGTPSYLEEEDLRKLLEAIDKISKTKDYEYSCEANPESFTESKAIIMKENGVNRISLGLQTTDDILLKNIGRIHNFQDFLKAYSIAKKYFNNVNFDLITALPGQSIDNIKESLEISVKLDPSHISIYSLILEEGTEFYKKVKAGKMILPSEDEDREFQAYAKDYLQSRGYKRYEISNYAKASKECRHNINYWKCGDYIGVGIGAAGYEDGVRYVNSKSLSEYIEAMNKGQILREEEEKISKEASMEEFIFMGLRLVEGISLDFFKEKFGVDFKIKYKSILDKYINSGHLILMGDRLYFSDKGFDISNYILADFLG